MIKSKNNCSSMFIISFLSVVFMLLTGSPVKAENPIQADDPAKERIVSKEQSHLLAQMNIGSPKKDKPSKSESQNADNEDDDITKVEDEQDLMERAVELLEIADNCWKSGDIENTLNTLDKAYALLLDTNGDVEIARQKDDLRLLISRRLLAVYSSQQTRTNGKASEIQLIMNADVEKEIRSFQGREREFFMSSYQRSGMYREIIIGELRKAGIPEELFWLPLVESGFKVGALSSARALGLWQFIPSTGYKFGMTRDEWIDERMDILKSTHAAIAYLKELHGMFGDWMTVLASYNCGEGRVLRVISRQHINYFDRFWDLYSQLPRETARYVPRFLATLHIIKNPARYGFELPTPMDSLLNYETVKVDKMMKLSDVAARMDASEDIINILNAELRYRITPNREYALKIPSGSLEKFNLAYNDIPATERPTVSYTRATYIKHRVRSGETVYSISKRYRVSSGSIYASNKISKKKRLYKGQIIRIPVNRVETAATKQKPSVSRSNKVESKKIVSVKTYKVKPGDSLFGIANRFNVPVAKLKEINKLKSNSIQAGRNLKIPSKEIGKDNTEKQNIRLAQSSANQPRQLGNKLSVKDVENLGNNTHIVTRGESLSIISRKYNIKLTALAQMNNLSEDSNIRPGQVLVVGQ